MAKRKFRQYLTYLPFFLIFMGATTFILFRFPPDYKLPISIASIPILPFFFASLFASIFSLVTFISRDRLQGIVFASLTVFYLFLRYLELTSLLFLGLILALFVTIELFIYKKR